MDEQQPTLQTAPTAAPLGAIGAPVPATPPGKPDTSAPFGQSEGVPAGPIPLPNFQQRWQSGESGEGLTPRPSKLDELEAGFQKGLHGPTDALLRFYAEKTMPQGKTLSPADAEKQYPGRPIPYTTPVNENIARMEYNDRQKQQQLDEWMSRSQTTGAKVAQTVGGLGAMIADPISLGIGMMSGGLSELVTPAAAPFAAKIAAHYLANWGGFTAMEATQNILEHQMGAKSKQMKEIIGDTAVPALVMTGVGVGLSALARRFLNTGEATPEAMNRGIKETVSELEQDRRPPSLEEQRAAMAERKAGVNAPAGPNSEKINPGIVTSPIQETKLYAATHSDGSPLIHEHGLGAGAQMTDNYHVANNGVSRASELPGQIGETKIPPESKLLQIDQSASAEYESKDSLLKAIEEKTGIPIEGATRNGESIKDIITALGDHAGHGDVPEDILKQIQDLAKEKGYAGYQFAGDQISGQPTNRQVHMFDTTGMSIDNAYSADPSTTPEIGQRDNSLQGLKGAQPAQMQNPALDKTRESFYSPEIEKLVHDFHKNQGDLFEYSPENIAKILKDSEDLKQKLSERAKESPTAEAELENIRDQEAQDKRLLDIAKRIVECGAGGGV